MLTPFDVPELIYIEASAFRALAGHMLLVLVSAYLSPTKSLLKSDLQSLRELSKSVLIAGDPYCKQGSWNSSKFNSNDRVLFGLGQHHNFNVIAPNTPTVLDITLLKVSLSIFYRFRLERL